MFKRGDLVRVKGCAPCYYIEEQNTTYEIQRVVIKNLWYNTFNLELVTSILREEET